MPREIDCFECKGTEEIYQGAPTTPYKCTDCKDGKIVIYTQAEFDEVVKTEIKITNKMIHWAVYYWNLTQSDLDEDAECNRMDAKREDFKRIAERARRKDNAIKTIRF